jgi:hypothetical protein
VSLKLSLRVLVFEKLLGFGNYMLRDGGEKGGIATVKLADGVVLDVELHWYEATGIGKREFKIKHYL